MASNDSGHAGLGLFLSVALAFYGYVASKYGTIDPCYGLAKAHVENCFSLTDWKLESAPRCVYYKLSGSRHISSKYQDEKTTIGCLVEITFFEIS